jgi:hypothetical protein
MSNMLHNQSCQMHFSMSINFTCGKNDTLRQNRRNCGSLFLVRWTKFLDDGRHYVVSTMKAYFLVLLVAHSPT